MTDIPLIDLKDGNKIPQIGFGIWKVPQDNAADVVANAIRTGYRLIDGAFIYGNEQGLGEGVRRAEIPREDIFITTKIWNADQGMDKARTAVDRSLKTIGIDQLDMMLIHWPVPSEDLYVETWKAMIEMKKEGKIRSIGVSNFNADHLERLIGETGEPPVVNQIEVNPTLQQPDMRLANAQYGIVTEAWTPLGQGKSFEADPIRTIAEHLGKTPAQIVLRWHIQLGNVVIPRSENPERQKQNMQVFDFTLSDEEMASITSLDIGLRCGPDPSVFKLK